MMSLTLLLILLLLCALAYAAGAAVATAKARRRAQEERENDVNRQLAHLGGHVAELLHDKESRDNERSHAETFPEVALAPAGFVVHPELMTDADYMDLAEAGYNAYGEYAGWKVASGADMPKWAAQEKSFQLKWGAAALGMLRRLKQKAD